MRLHPTDSYDNHKSGLPPMAVITSSVQQNTYQQTKHGLIFILYSPIKLNFEDVHIVHSFLIFIPNQQYIHFCPRANVAENNKWEIGWVL